MKKITIAIMSITLLLFLSACNNTASDAMHIGVIQYAQHPALDASYEGFIEELNNMKLKEGVDYVVDYQNAQGDSATAETIADKLVSDQNDLIYAIGTPAAQAVANKTDEIPIVVAAVTDPKSAGLVLDNAQPGTNVSGVSDLTPVTRQIALLKEILPEAKTVAIMYANSEDNSRFQAEAAKVELETIGINVIDASVSESNQIQQMVESFITKVDAIYVPTDNLISENFSIVANVANENKVATVVGEIAMVKTGGLITDGINYLNVGKKAGHMAYSVLVEEEDISQLPIIFLDDKQLELAINVNTQKEIGITISEKLLEKAILVEED